jgi:U4/U6.U5 tri-snRNP-associated protein 1
VLRRSLFIVLDWWRSSVGVLDQRIRLLIAMADAESLSLEETNKIRISLGLAPLKPPSAETTSAAGEDGDVPPDDEKRAFDNLKALRTEQAKTADEAALRRRLQK